jgi:predicted secreted Zn-dependent protease
MNTHEELILVFNLYLKEIKTFEEKKVKAAAPRARTALHELAKLAKQRRQEIQDVKREM